MSKEKLVDDYKKFLDETRLLENSRLEAVEKADPAYITLENVNNGESIELHNLSHERYESLYAVPGIVNFIETIVKNARFDTIVSGTYESETLNLKETLSSIEIDYSE